MQNNRYNAQSEQTRIERFIEWVTELFIRIGKRESQNKIIGERLNRLDNANPGFKNALHDVKENMLMFWLTILPLATAFIDYILMYTSLNIIIPAVQNSLKFILAVAVVLLELIISYYVKNLDKDRNTVLTRVLPYTVIVLLGSITFSSLWYAAQGYRPEVDGNSFWGYMFPTILHQGSLFFGSVLLHICVIKSAADIHEYLGFAIYRLKRLILISKLPKGGHGINSSDGKAFISAAPKLVQLIESFHQSYPGVNMYFVNVIPEDVRIGVNRVMGYEAIKRTGDNDYVSFTEETNPKK